MHVQSIRTIVLLTAAAVQFAAADTTPRDAIAELALRLNSRFVDEVVGPVDFDYAYVDKGTHAYPIEEVAAVHMRADVQLLPDGKTRRLRQIARDDTSDSVLWTLSPDRVDKKILKAKKNKRRGRDSAAQGDSAAAVRRDDPRPPQAERYAFTWPFAADSSRSGGQGPRWRFHGDRRGDAASFDLSGVDVEALMRRAERGQGPKARLGVAVSRPSKRGLKAVTRIDTEHSMAERRLMRLDLRELYATIPPGVYLAMEIEEIALKGRRARAKVRWGYSDRPQQHKSATLSLEQAAAGWRVVRAWDFIEGLAQGR